MGMNGCAQPTESKPPRRVARVQKVLLPNGEEAFESIKYHEYNDNDMHSTYEEAEREGRAWCDTPVLKDYEQRLIIEIEELRDRMSKLGNMLCNWDNLNFEPECSCKELSNQLSGMAEYYNAIMRRADVKRLIEKGYIKGEEND